MVETDSTLSAESHRATDPQSPVEFHSSTFPSPDTQPDGKLRQLAQKVGDDWKQQPYYDLAESHIDRQWLETVWPFIQDADFTNVVDLAAGHGRNSEKLKQYARSIHIVDINQENIDFCRRRFAGDSRFSFTRNDGCSLNFIPPDSVSLLYCFDAMVHFDSDVVRTYLKEFRRILKPGGLGFCHHSNYTENPGENVHTSPGWRNFMSQALFAHYCAKEGLTVVKSRVIDWERPGSDCLTLFRKEGYPSAINVRTTTSSSKTPVPVNRNRVPQVVSLPIFNSPNSATRRPLPCPPIIPAPIKGARSGQEAALPPHQPEPNLQRFHDNATDYFADVVPPQLTELNLRNSRIVPTRDHILPLMPKGGICAEVGTQTGGFAKLILSVLQPAKLHIYDIDYTVFDHAHFEQAIERGTVELHQGDSSTLLANLPDRHFDFIYIDGDHSYEGVARDLAQAARKIKDDGWIVCNDYTIYSPLEKSKYGVYRAVNELCLQHQFEIVYLGLHRWGYHDVALRKTNAAPSAEESKDSETAPPATHSPEFNGTVEPVRPGREIPPTPSVHGERSKAVVVVLGMPRSGTSLLTNLLQGLNVDLGEKLSAPDANNPAGYWEQEEICQTQESLLEHFGRRWIDETGTMSFPANWWQLREVKPYQDRLSAIVSGELSRCNGLWGFKDPRTSRTIPLWNQIFAQLHINPIYLLAVREPASAVESMMKLYQLPPARTQLLWLLHNLDAVRDAGHRLRLVVDYDRWFSHPREQAQAVARALDVQWPDDEDHLLSALRQRIRPDLRHCHTRQPSSLPFLAETFAALKSASATGQIPGELQHLDREVRRAMSLGEAWSSVVEKLTRPQPGSYSFVENFSDARFQPLGAGAQSAIWDALLNGPMEKALFLHPPARLHFHVPDGRRARLTFAVSIHPHAWGKPNAGGCEFILTVDGTVRSTVSVDPVHLASDRRWHECTLDIPENPDNEHQVIFETRTWGNSFDYRWAVWRHPRLTWIDDSPVLPRSAFGKEEPPKPDSSLLGH